MYVNVTPDPGNAGNYLTALGGSMVRTPISGDDQKLFRMSDGAVKAAIAKFAGYPDDIFYNDPTPWNNLFATYGWTPVTLTLVPLSAQVTNVSTPNSALAFNKVTNNLSKPVKANVAFQTQMQDTAQTSWSETSTLTVTQDVSFTVGFFGTTSTVSFAQAWQKGGSRTTSVTIGSTTSIEVTLDPHETVLVQNWGDTGTATVAVTYQASLSGGVACNYGNKWNGHHFWYFDINSVLANLGGGVPNSVRAVQELDLTAYLYTNTTVSDSSGGLVAASVNPALHRAADAVPQHPAELVVASR